MPLILVLRKQKQVDLCEFKASLVYRVSSRTARPTERNPVLGRKTKPHQWTCLCWHYTHGSVTFHWNMSNIPGFTLKENWFFVPQKVTDNRLSARLQSSGVLQPFHAGMMTGFKSCAGINGCCQYMRAKILSYPEDTVASWYPWLLTLTIVLAPLLRCPSNLGGLGVLVFIVSLTQLIFTWKIEPQLINYPDQTGLWPCV